MSPTPCHACTAPAGPSGFCAPHQNRLNARANGLLDHMTLADRIALAAHPGWRGRAHRLMVVLSPNDQPRYTCVNVEATRRMWAQRMRVFDTAVEALAELDRRNGIPAPAADVARLEAELAAAVEERDAYKAERDEARRALVDVQSIVAGVPWGDPATLISLTLGVETVSKVADFRRELTSAERERDAARQALAEMDEALTEAESSRDTARRRVGKLEQECDAQRHRAEAAEDALRERLAEVERERDAIRTHRDALEERRRELARDLIQMEGWLAFATASVDVATRGRSIVRAECDRLSAELAAAKGRIDAGVSTYRRASETADYMRERLLPALDAAGVRYDDPPEALRLWVERQEEILDRQASDIARLSAERDALRAKLAEAEDLCRELDEGVTIACADRDAYARDLEAELALALRPWWVKLWAWVAGGGGK